MLHEPIPSLWIDRSLYTYLSFIALLTLSLPPLHILSSLSPRLFVACAVRGLNRLSSVMSPETLYDVIYSVSRQFDTQDISIILRQNAAKDVLTTLTNASAHPSPLNSTSSLPDLSISTSSSTAHKPPQEGRMLSAIEKNPFTLLLLATIYVTRAATQLTDDGSSLGPPLAPLDIPRYVAGAGQIV